MKDTTANRLKLQARMQEGEEAKRLLSQLDPSFEKLQQHYVTTLVESVRRGDDEKAIYRESCKIAALDDVVTELHETARTGARAQAMATQMESLEAGK